MCLLLRTPPPDGRLQTKAVLLLFIFIIIVVAIVGYPLLTHKHKRTQRHMHAQTAKDNRVRANYGHARAHESLFPQRLCLGLLFCVPASMYVSLVGNAASRRAFATENGVVIIGPPLTHKRKQTSKQKDTCTHRQQKTIACALMTGMHGRTNHCSHNIFVWVSFSVSL